MIKNKTTLLILIIILSVSQGVFAVTVGAGAEYPTIKAAVEAYEVVEGEQLVIALVDELHTEAGIVIDSDVVIKGRGAGASVVQAAEHRGEASERVFTVTSEGRLELHSLTVRYGRPSEIPLRGGGIDNEGELLMYSCRIVENDAVYGAGIFTRGYTEINNCLIGRNSTHRASQEIRMAGIGCTGSGGGIKTEKGAVLKIYSSTLAWNSSIKRGGGIFVACESRAEIVNTTIAENSCRERGGGICSKGDLLLRFSTVAGNESVQRGSGLCNMGRLSIISSLLTGNSYGDFAEIRSHGIYGEGFTEDSHSNFCSDGSLPGADSGNSGAGSLKQFGITSFLVPIGIFSPARNICEPEEELPADGRGVRRDMRPDAGAYEFRPVPWKL